jgi:MoaA/NifB/PqqE/SkfB family radical SAM enzyme
MIPIAITSNQPSNFIKISYSVTDICNFKCRYCFPGSNSGKYKWPANVSQVVDNFSHLFDYYKRNGKTQIELQLLGGEPTLWPEVDQFLSRLKEQHEFRSSIQSNGSRTLRWWQEKNYIFDKVNLSAHYKEINLQHFTEVADLLYRNGVYVDVSVCMDPYEWNKCIDMIEYFKNSKYKWYIGTQKIEEADGANLYSPEQILFLSNSIKRYPNLWYAFKMRNHFHINRSKIKFNDGTTQTVRHNQVALNDWNHFFGWNCNIGKESLYINPKGIMEGSCSNRLYGLDAKYNIYDADFISKFNPELKSAVCEHKTCICAPETRISKSIKIFNA